MLNLSVKVKKNNRKTMNKDNWYSKIMMKAKALKDVVEL